MLCSCQPKFSLGFLTRACHLCKEEEPHRVCLSSFKRPSPESTSDIDGGSAPKKSRVKCHVFTPLEKEILVNLYNTNKIKDTKGIHDVVVLLSKDDSPLS